MRKISISAFIFLMILTPLSLANVCEDVNSPEYMKAAGSKLVRGVGNVAFSWVELFRQPAINQNKWEGVGRGIFHTGLRALAGAGDAVTFLFPKVAIPQLEPACPTDLVNTETGSTASASS